MQTSVGPGGSVLEQDGVFSGLHLDQKLGHAFPVLGIEALKEEVESINLAEWPSEDSVASAEPNWASVGARFHCPGGAFAAMQRLNECVGSIP